MTNITYVHPADLDRSCIWDHAWPVVNSTRFKYPTMSKIVDIQISERCLIKFGRYVHTHAAYQGKTLTLFMVQKSIMLASLISYEKVIGRNTSSERRILCFYIQIYILSSTRGLLSKGISIHK